MIRWTMKLLTMCAIFAVGPTWAASLAPGLLDELRHGG